MPKLGTQSSTGSATISFTIGGFLSSIGVDPRLAERDPLAAYDLFLDIMYGHKEPGTAGSITKPVVAEPTPWWHSEPWAPLIPPGVTPESPRWPINPDTGEPWGPTPKPTLPDEPMGPEWPFVAPEPPEKPDWWRPPMQWPPNPWDNPNWTNDEPVRPPGTFDPLQPYSAPWTQPGGDPSPKVPPGYWRWLANPKPPRET